MQLRGAYSLVLLSFLGLVAGAPDGANKPKPSATPTGPPKPPPTSSCTNELLCCLQATDPTGLSAKLILDLLHISLTPEEKSEEVGLTCSTLHKRGFGDTCFEKPLCCDKSFESGIIAVGCKAVSI
ncbi:uncharacterized protein FOMMEDRAFT_16409 [Fomitiporia mediterranea MF3/22]|uniref:uncharacterized protein n=1 Tax=Fomitiporia mediterranea (strain MF3/22) TaxID=694068 RepID=UPI00044092EE|nr:uncharacterized protein FOMMEDRAFT_16409 [Fomitiporia mediterranea MF3/22]EJD07791.1 hypothetical protein FOMMEDRAFT_16409 [Fomitiporia mediterranea MF3/22]